MSHSSYFNEVLSYGIDDDSDNEQIVILPDVPVQTFTIFANFIRFGNILSSQPNDFEVRSLPERRYHFDKEWLRLAGAWHLGDRLRSTTFQDAVVDALALKVNRDQSWPIDLYKSFYTTELPRVCGIKRLLVDLALCLWDEETLQLEELEESGERFHEFFEDLVDRREEMERIAERGLKIETKCLDLGCEYHDHGEEVCYRETLPDLWVTGNGLVSGMEEQEKKGKVMEIDDTDDEDDEEMIEVVKQEDADEEMKSEESDGEMRKKSRITT